MWSRVASIPSSEERLKAAICLWRKQRDYFKDKSNLLCLYNWLSSSICALYKDKHKPADKPIEVHYWKLFADVVRSISPSENVEFSQQLVKVMIQALEQDGDDQTGVAVVDSLNSILSLDPLPVILYKIETMLPLTVALLKSLNHTIPTATVTTSVASTVAVKCIHHVTYILSIQGNSKKVYVNICQSMLSPLLLVWHKLPSDDVNASNAIGCLLKSFFTWEHLSQYLSLVAQDHTHSDSTQSFAKCNYTSHIITQLKNMFDCDDTRGCVLAALPLLLIALTEQNKLNCQLSSIQQFQVFMLFIGVLHNEHINTEEWSVHVVKHLSRIALQDDDSEMITDSKSDSLLILTCLHNCLEIIHQENVYKLSEDPDNQQLVSIIVLACNHVSLNSSVLEAWYSCLKVLLTLNHKLIEPLIPTLWTLLFTLNTLGQQELTQIEPFYDSLVKQFVKLHQFKVLVDGILSSIKDTSANSLTPLVIPQFIHQCFRSVHVPIGQTVLILQLIATTLKEYYSLLAELPMNGGKRRRRESSKDHAHIRSHPPDKSISALNCIVSILDTLLLPLPLSAFNSGRCSADLVSVVTDLIESLCVPLMKLASNMSELQCPALYMFVVIAKLFYPLQSLYPESVSTITGMCLQMKWTTNMVPWPGYWEGVAEPHPPVLDLLVRQFCLLCLRFGEDSNISSVMEYLTSLSVMGGAWDGEILTVSSTNQCTACWCVLMESLPLIAPYITSTDVWRRVAVFIVTQLSNIATGQTVVDELLCSAVYVEMNGLHYQLILEAMKQTGKMWPKKFCKELRDVLIDSSVAKLDSDLIETTIALPQSLVTDRIVKQLTKFIEFLPVPLKVFNSLPVSRSHASHVTHIVFKLSTLLIAAKVAIAHTNRPSSLSPLSPLLLTLCKVLDQMLGSVAVSKKKIWSSIHVLLPWLLNIGAESVDNKEVLVLVLVAMEKVFEYQLKTHHYPIDFVKMLRTESSTSDDGDIHHKCFNLLYTVSNTQCSQDVHPTPELHKYRKRLDKYSKHFSTRVFRSWHDYYFQLKLNYFFTSLFYFVHSSLPPTIAQLSIEPGYWNTIQTNLHSQLKAFPLQHFVTHRGLLVSHPLPGEPSITILDKVSSSQALIRFQQQTDYDKWRAFVDTCKLLSVMKAGICDTSQSIDSVSGLFSSVMASTVVQQSLYETHDCCESRDRLCLIVFWLCALESDMHHNGRMALMKFRVKILVYAIHFTIDTATIKCSRCHGDRVVMTICGLRLLELLAMLPTKVGLTSRSVIVLMHVFGGITLETLSSSPQILLKYQDLLLSLIYNHSTVLANCSAVLLSPLMKCVACNVSLAQHPDSNEDTASQVISTFTRLLESLVQKPWFSKSAVYLVAQYLTCSERAPMDKRLKGSLESAVILVLRLITDRDRNYLLSSMEEQGRENLQNLFDNYQKFHKFKGKV